jgi:hypothetical protein
MVIQEEIDAEKYIMELESTLLKLTDENETIWCEI